jgi:hypothetical protein
MANGKSGTSIWKWMWVLFILSIPGIGTIMVIVWSIYDKVEARRNFFRAILAWWVIIAALWITLVILGFTPAVQKWVGEKVQSYAKSLADQPQKPSKKSGAIVY